MAPFLDDLSPHQVEHCISVLREFMEWRPGPAGRVKDVLSHQESRGSARRVKGDSSRPSCAKRCPQASARMDAISVGDIIESLPRRRHSPVTAPAEHYEWQPAPGMHRVPSSVPLGIAAYLSAPMPYPDSARLVGASQRDHGRGQALSMSATQTSTPQDLVACFSAHACGDSATAVFGEGTWSQTEFRRLCTEPMKRPMLHRRPQLLQCLRHQAYHA